MNTVTNSPISFKSKIVFVSTKTYKTICKKLEKTNVCKNIKNWDVCPHSFEEFWLGEDYWCGWRRNVINGYTRGVKTCTAGLCVDKSKPAPLFWHIENTEINHKQVNKLKPFLAGTSAIIVGSKPDFNYSRAIFEKFKRFTKKNNLPTTFFQELKYSWQANLAYTAKDDTLYLNINNIDNPQKHVRSLKDLYNTFLKVKISPRDNLEFPNKIKDFLLRFKNFE